MTVIDTVDADSLESGDTISLDDDEIEVYEILDTGDLVSVSIRGYSLTHDSVQTYEIPFNQRVDILGV